MIDVEKDVLAFWFEQTKPQQWFQADPEFDDLIRDRFIDAHRKAAVGTFDGWKNSPEGCLALCILLDQFPRNMFRGMPEAFGSDDKAKDISEYALSRDFDQDLSSGKRRFLYLPFEHSEDLNDQRKCVDLFETIKDDDPLGYDYAVRHLKVIEQFGRFPHRNKILGRMNTPDENVYLAQSDSGF